MEEDINKLKDLNKAKDTEISKSKETIEGLKSKAEEMRKNVRQAEDSSKQSKKALE